jgi:hypothetical protein
MQDGNETVFETKGTKLIFHPTHPPFTSQIGLGQIGLGVSLT